MRQILLSTLLIFILSASMAFAIDGLVTIKSAHDVATTTDRLITALETKGMTVFARIDHAAGAVKSGQTLRPTELVIFGNPKVGTPLMQCAQTVGIDLPQKALIYEDNTGQTWFSYNDPAYLDQRHHLEECAAVLKKVSTALGNFSAAATAP